MPASLPRTVRRLMASKYNASRPKTHLLQLPAELLEKIYDYIFYIDRDWTLPYVNSIPSLPILKVCQQLRHELIPHAYGQYEYQFDMWAYHLFPHSQSYSCDEWLFVITSTIAPQVRQMTITTEIEIPTSCLVSTPSLWDPSTVEGTTPSPELIAAHPTFLVQLEIKLDEYVLHPKVTFTNYLHDATQGAWFSIWSTFGLLRELQREMEKVRRVARADVPAFFLELQGVAGLHNVYFEEEEYLVRAYTILGVGLVIPRIWRK